MLELSRVARPLSDENPSENIKSFSSGQNFERRFYPIGHVDNSDFRLRLLALTILKLQVDFL